MINLDNLFFLSIEAYTIEVEYIYEGVEYIYEGVGSAVSKVYPTADAAEAAYNDALMRTKSGPGLNNHKIYIKPCIVYNPLLDLLTPGEYYVVRLAASEKQLEKRPQLIFNKDLTLLTIE